MWFNIQDSARILRTPCECDDKQRLPIPPHTAKQPVCLCHINCKPVSSEVAAVSLCVMQMLDQKQLENFEMWCWRRTEKISWTDRVRN